MMVQLSWLLEAWQIKKVEGKLPMRLWTENDPETSFPLVFFLSGVPEGELQKHRHHFYQLVCLERKNGSDHTSLSKRLAE
jgi:hypothetical protein